jgi:ISXO2-like transposase domain
MSTSDSVSLLAGLNFYSSEPEPKPDSVSLLASLNFYSSKSEGKIDLDFGDIIKQESNMPKIDLDFEDIIKKNLSIPEIDLDFGDILKPDLSISKLLEIHCSEHQTKLQSCEACNDKLTSGFISRKNNSKLLKKLENELDATSKLKAEVELLKNELNDLYQLNKVSTVLGEGNLYKQLFLKSLPNSLFCICERADMSLSFMLKIGVFPETILCKKCSVGMALQGRGGVGFLYKCYICKFKCDYKTGTFWEKVSLQPNQILWFMILWILKARDIEISHLMELSLSYVSALSARIRRLISKDYTENLPVFYGIVEVDIKNFVKRKIEIGKSKSKERWVLIMVERERKLTYMQVITEKSPSVVIPIIQKRCEIGTIIITEAWHVYGRLENYGYPHYVLDMAQGFAHVLNPRINICNVYGQWAWIKYAVKRYNRISTNLDEHLAELQWRRHMKHRHKDYKTLEGMLGLVLSTISKAKIEETEEPLVLE